MNYEESDCPEVIVTAGGTREPIDDVRYIGNFSSGRLGHALATHYAELGYRTLLLAPLALMERFGQGETDSEFEHRSFTTAADLKEQLLSIPSADLVLHAAAVSDYTPERSSGKISSDEEELVVRMKRNPKILGILREHFGHHAKLVGFKLLSGVDETKLISVGQQQIKQNNTDLCIANDLDMILPEQRTIHIVRPDGDHSRVVGSTHQVAQAIAAQIRPEVVSHA